MSTETLWRREEANFLKSTARKGCEQAQLPCAATLSSSLSLARRFSVSRSLPLDSIAHASCWKSLGCRLVFLALQQDTNHLRPHPRLRVTHIQRSTGTYSYVCPPTRARNTIQPTVTRRPRGKACSAAKCYLTNHLADPWPETTGR